MNLWGGVVIIAVLAVLSFWVGFQFPEAMAEIESTNVEDPVCDGIYCGGSVWKSPLGLLIPLALLVAITGLLIAAGRWKK